MRPGQEPDQGYVNVTEVEVDAVAPSRSGFILSGRGKDRADYRLVLELELPIDQHTRAVLGEMLAQSTWRLLRRAREPFGAPRRGHTPNRVS